MQGHGEAAREDCYKQLVEKRGAVNANVFSSSRREKEALRVQGAAQVSGGCSRAGAAQQKWNLLHQR